MVSPDQFTFVLFQPKSPGNVGAAARALKNMGFRDLRLVAPQGLSNRAEQAMAAHARDVLDGAGIFTDLSAAIDGCGLVVGTTCRAGLYRNGARPVREAAAELASLAARNRVAIVFGPEDFGLTNRELKLCQRLITIPTAPDYPSLNLAQAVMVVAYELMMASAATAAADASSTSVELASATEIEAVLARMADALVAIGFLPADNPDHIMFALRAMLGRSGITPRECDILNGIAHQIAWFASGGHETLDSKRRAGRKIR